MEFSEEGEMPFLEKVSNAFSAFDHSGRGLVNLREIMDTLKEMDLDDDIRTRVFYAFNSLSTDIEGNVSLKDLQSVFLSTCTPHITDEENEEVYRNSGPALSFEDPLITLQKKHRKEMEKMVVQIEKQREENSSLLSQITQMEDMMSVSESQNEKLSTDLYNAKKENDLLKKDIRDLRNVASDNDSISTVLAELRAQLVAKESKIQDLVKDKLNLQSQLRADQQSLVHDADSAQQTVREMEKQLHASSAKVIQLEAKCQALEEQVIRARNSPQLHAAAKAIEETKIAKEELMKLQSELDVAKGKIITLHEKVEETLSEKSQLEQIVAEQEDKLAMQTLERNRQEYENSLRMSAGARMSGTSSLEEVQLHHSGVRQRAPEEKSFWEAFFPCCGRRGKAEYV